MSRLNDFCCKNKLYIFICSLILLLVHGSRFFTRNVSIDTLLFTVSPETNYNWLGIGRWGMVLTKKLGGLSRYNPFAVSVFAFIMMILACVIWAYLFYSVSGENRGVFFAFGIIFFTNQVFALQFFFQIQVFELMFSMLLIPIALMLIYNWIDNKKLSFCIAGIACMVWIFSTYQSNVILYISGAISCFLLYKQNNLKDSVQIILKLVLTFLIGYILYILINKLFFTSSGYLESNIWWGKLSVKECVDLIWQHMIQLLIGAGVFFNKCYLALLIILTMIFFAEIRNYNLLRFVKCIALGVLLLMPFAMTLYLGHMPVERSQTSIGFVLGIGFVLVYCYFSTNKKYIIRKLGLLLTIMIIGITMQKQMYTTLKLYYTDDIRFKEDIYILQQIQNDINEIGGFRDRAVIFIGKREANLNASCYPAGTQGIEYYGTSCFSLMTDTKPYYYTSSFIINDLSATIGMPFLKPTVEQVERAREFAVDMPSWPSKGAVVGTEDMIVVKLSEDILPK